MTNQDDHTGEDCPPQPKQQKEVVAKTEKKPFVVPTLSQPVDVLEATRFFFNVSSPPLSGGGSSDP